MTRPLIGLLLDESAGADAGFSRRPYYAIRKDYVRMLESAGCAVVGITYSELSFKALLDRCDGWVIPGGEYKFPREWYRMPPPANAPEQPDRSLFEGRALQVLLERDAVILGVCAGMQLLAAITGGKVDYAPTGGEVEHAAFPDGRLREHEIQIASSSRLETIVGANAAIVNSSHKERVISLGPAATALAWTADGVIEALEIKGKRFALGVQWHPDLSDDAVTQSLLSAFAAAAAVR